MKNKTKQPPSTRDLYQKQSPDRYNKQILDELYHFDVAFDNC